MLKKKTLTGIFIVVVVVLVSFLYQNESSKDKIVTTKKNYTPKKIENPDESCGCQEPDPSVGNILDITSSQSKEKELIQYK